MNLYKEQIASEVRMLRLNLGRKVAHQIIADALIDARLLRAIRSN